MEDNINYYAIIPANVRYDKELNANAKLLYGEITSLCNKEGFCWATNQYFADLYDASERSIKGWIKQLKDKGYIDAETDYTFKKTGLRKITIMEGVKKIAPLDGRGEKIFTRGVKKNSPIILNINNKERDIINNISKESDLSFNYVDISRDLIPIIESYNFSHDLISVICEFIISRKKLKKPLTPYALKINLNKLVKLSSDDKERIKIINQSIEKGYQGLFAVNTNQTQTFTANKKDIQKHEYTDEDYNNMTSDLDAILNDDKGE